MYNDIMEEKIKILFDTDIGNDIDDAFALAYLLAQEKCDLLGITTVSGDTHKRAKLASVFCKIAEKEIPIIVGQENRLDGPSRQPQVPGSLILSKWEHDSNFSKKTSTEFIADLVRKYPYQIVLLAEGPMTNIASLFLKYPDIPPLLKSLRLMSGSFFSLKDSPIAEWNVYCDPKAAQVVYSTPVSSHTSIGLDVTLKLDMNFEEVNTRFNHDFLKPIIDMFDIWIYHTKKEKIIFHDPLAALTIFDDQICRYKNGIVSIKRSMDRLDGITYLSENKNGPHSVATTVNKEIFFESYFRVFN